MKKTKPKKKLSLADPEAFIAQVLGMVALSKETNLVLSVSIPSKNKAFIDIFRDTTPEERKRKKNTALHALHISYTPKKGIQVALARPQLFNVSDKEDT
jgi:hypothetical protein